MTNTETLKSLCNAMCNTFYPDDKTIELMLFNEQIEKDAEAKPKDKDIFRLAVNLVVGYVEGSRSENSVSTSVLTERVKESIKYYCGIYGVDVSDVLPNSIVQIKDGSKLW